MMGLAGLILTSSTGAATMLIPQARASAAVTAAACAHQRAIAGAPRAIAVGRCVAPPITKPMPASASTPISNGRVAAACSRLTIAAVTAGLVHLRRQQPDAAQPSGRAAVSAESISSR